MSEIDENNGVKFTPNPDFWTPIEGFWERIKESDMLSGGVCGRPWNDLVQAERDDVAVLFRIAKDVFAVEWIWPNEVTVDRIALAETIKRIATKDAAI